MGEVRLWTAKIAQKNPGFICRQSSGGSVCERGKKAEVDQTSAFVRQLII
jgi:hypothetical protein